MQLSRLKVYWRLVITALCNNFVTFAFNTVVYWRKLGEVENEYISYNIRLFAIFVPKIIRFGESLT